MRAAFELRHRDGRRTVAVIYRRRMRTPDPGRLDRALALSWREWWAQVIRIYVECWESMGWTVVRRVAAPPRRNR